MELTEVVQFAFAFEFNLDGFVTRGEVYKYLPDTDYWDKLKAAGVIVEAEAKEIADDLKGADNDEARKKVLQGIVEDVEKSKQVDRVYFATLAGMLKSWDVTIKGEPVPISIEGIEQVSKVLPAFVTALFNYLVAKRTENFRSGTSSSPGLPEKEKTESVPLSIESDTDSTQPPNTGTAPSSIS